MPGTGAFYFRGFLPTAFYTGGTISYAEWLTQIYTSQHVLCEIQPAEYLNVWTAVPGKPNTFSAPWASLTETDVVPGGIYRRLDVVKINAYSLTLRTTIAQVDSNPGSYYFDEAASTLYVSTPSGLTPNVYAAALAFFSVFFATEPVDFLGWQLYEPRLTASLPTAELKSDDPLFGVKQYSSGAITLVNADKLFDRLVRKWIWKNKKVTLKFGGGALAYADHATIAVLRIDDVTPNDDACTLTVRSMASLLDKQLPLNTFTSAEYPRLASGLEATYKPLLYGAKTNIPGLCIDTQAGAQVYLVADPAAQVLTGVSAVRAKNRSTGVVTPLVLTTDYTVNLAACTVTVINATYTQGAYDLQIDATGESNGSGGYLSTCGEISKDILLLLGEDAANIDAAAFTAASTSDPSALGLWIRDYKQASEYLRLIEQSVFGAVFVGRSGLWTMNIWSPLYDESALPSLSDEDVAQWSVDDKLETIFPTVRVRYDRNPSTNDMREASSSDSRVQYGYETADSASLETVLLSATQASVVAQRYRLIAGSPTVNITIEERGLTQMNAQPFDKLLVTRARAPHESGSYANQAMEIIAIKKQLAPPRVILTVGDLRGFGDRVGRITANTDSPYATASAEERSRNGYITDSNGLIDPADSTTRDQSILY